MKYANLKALVYNRFARLHSETDAIQEFKYVIEQNTKMYEALKKVYAEYGDPKNYDFLESFLKEIES